MPHKFYFTFLIRNWIHFLFNFIKITKASELSSFWIGHYPVVEVLLNHSANINVKNSDGTPVLNVASRRNGNKLKSVGAAMFFPVFEEALNFLPTALSIRLYSSIKAQLRRQIFEQSFQAMLKSSSCWLSVEQM